MREISDKEYYSDRTKEVGLNLQTSKFDPLWFLKKGENQLNANNYLPSSMRYDDPNVEYTPADKVLYEPFKEGEKVGVDETVLQEANRIIYGDREQTYGHPAKNFEATAILWNAYLLSKGTAIIRAVDVAHMMMLLKMAREVHQHKRDNIVDMAGYAGCIQKMEDYNG